MTTNQFVISSILRCNDANVNGWGNRWAYDFKIDINGNVYVKYGTNNCSDIGQPYSQSYELFSIIDNIKVPDYILSLYKQLIFTTPNHMRKSLGDESNTIHTIQLFLEIVKGLKKSVEENIANPLLVSNLTSQLDYTYKKIEVLEETRKRRKFIFRLYYSIILLYLKKNICVIIYFQF